MNVRLFIKPLNQLPESSTAIDFSALEFLKFSLNVRLAGNLQNYCNEFTYALHPTSPNVSLYITHVINYDTAIVTIQ